MSDYRKAEAEITRALLRGVKLAAEHILGESQHQVPLEESTLQRSGNTDVETRGDEVVGSVSYDTPYAVVQHERMDFKHDAGRKAKYLEDPGNDAGRAVMEILVRELRKVS